MPAEGVADVVVANDHDLFESRIDDRQLVGAAHHRCPLLRRQSRAGGIFDGAQHPVVRALLIPLFEPAEPDVGEVLEPFEVGHDHSARVGVDIGDDQHPLVLEDGVGLWRRRTVGAF